VLSAKNVYVKFTNLTVSLWEIHDEVQLYTINESFKPSWSACDCRRCWSGTSLRAALWFLTVFLDNFFFKDLETQRTLLQIWSEYEIITFADLLDIWSCLVWNTQHINISSRQSFKLKKVQNSIELEVIATSTILQIMIWFRNKQYFFYPLLKSASYFVKILIL